MKFLPKEANNMRLRCTALRIWRLIGDVPGKFVRARRFDIRFSPGLSFSNYGKRGVDTNGGDPCGELARLTKSSQAGVCAEQGLLHCIFGILMVTDNGKDPSSGSLTMPPAELRKGPVVTRLSRLNKIVIRAQGHDQWLIMAVARRPHCECDRFESPGSVSSTHPKLHLAPCSVLDRKHKFPSALSTLKIHVGFPRILDGVCRSDHHFQFFG